MATCSKKMKLEAAYAEKNRLREMELEGVVEDENGNSLEESMAVINEFLNKLHVEEEAQARALLGDSAKDAVVASLGKELRVMFNGVKERKEKIVGAEMENNYIIVSTDKGTYRFMRGQDRSVNFQDSKRFVTVAGMGAVTNVLYNKKNFKAPKWSKFERLEKTVHGNIEAMKDLLEELHVAGGTKETVEHMEYLRELFGKINPKFLTKMSTYITEKGTEAGGMVEGNKIGIVVNKKPKKYGNQQTEAEVYAHEVIHSLTTFALHDGSIEARKANRELEHVMSVALKHLTWKNFLPDASIDKEREEQEAKAMYEYIFTDKNAKDEFIAHALTNPIVMEELKRVNVREQGKDNTLLESIVELFGTLVDVLLGNYKFADRNKNAYDRTVELAFQLAETNNRAVTEAKSKQSILTRVWDGLNKADVNAGEVLEGFYEKYLKDDTAYVKPPSRDDRIGYAKWVAGTVKKMLTNSEYQKSFELILSAWGIKPEGDLQTIFRDFWKSDELGRTVDMLALSADMVDQAKETLIMSVKNDIVNGFGRALTKEEEGDLTRVLIDTDVASIFEVYSNKELRAMLSDEKELDKAISRAKHELRQLDKKHADWHVNQANGLGYYLARHEGHVAQNLNALNIASGVLSTHSKKPDTQVVKAIDKVSTLVALKYTGRVEKSRVAELMKKEWNGVKNVVKHHKAFQDESKKEVFQDSKVHFIKGYSKELFSDEVSVEIATVSSRKEMEKKGYKLVKELESKQGKMKEKMGLYVADSYEVNDWYRTATRLTGRHSKGTTFSDVRYKEGDKFAKIKADTDKLIVDKERLEIVKKMEAGEIDLEAIEKGVVPVLNDDGSVVDYRYMMNKDAKINLMKQDTRVSEVLGQSVGHTLDKARSVEHNKSVWKVLEEDMKENYDGRSTLGKNGKEYVKIGPDATDPKLKELFEVMPPMFKKNILEMEGRALVVRRDMMHNYFGYRHLSVLDFPGLKQITPAMMHRLIKIAETLWMEFIKISKVDILIKMPVVIIGNIVSNFFYAVMTGTNPVELVKMYIDSTRDVRQFLNKHRELVELQVQDHVGNASDKDRMRIKKLEKELEDNPVKELVDLGLYQAIVEDISKADLVSKNKVKQKVDEYFGNSPQILKQGASWLYLTENTGYYKFMTEVLQMSDLVARDIENRKLKLIQNQQVDGKKPLPRWWVMRNAKKGDEYTQETRRLSGKEREEFMKAATKLRHETILDAFINYNKPSGKIEEYLNRVGAIMFTKYAKRIQRVIGETGVKYPIKSLLVLLGQEFLMDVETIQDQSFLNRSWRNLGLSDGDMVPFTNPWERIMEVMEPPAMQMFTSRVWP